MVLSAHAVQGWLQETCEREVGALRGPCVVKGPCAERDNSRLYYAQCAAFPTPLAVKLCLVPHTTQADALSTQSQFDAMSRVFCAMGESEDFSVPRPYLLQADRGLLAMEWIDGKCMTDLVFSLQCTRARAEMLMARAGHWLRRFHTCHALAPSSLVLDDKLDFVSELARSEIAADGVFYKALATLRQTAPTVARVMLNGSWIHGDFKTDNVMVCDGRTIGIDIHLRNEGAVIHDLAPFLNYVELRLFHPDGWRLFRARAALEQAFLRSYCDDTGDAMAVPLAWLRLYMILAAWCTAHAHGGSRMKLALLDYCHRLVAARLIRRLIG